MATGLILGLMVRNIVDSGRMAFSTAWAPCATRVAQSILATGSRISGGAKAVMRNQMGMSTKVIGLILNNTGSKS
jgi:hypothetical protein